MDPESISFLSGFFASLGRGKAAPSQLMRALPLLKYEEGRQIFVNALQPLTEYVMSVEAFGLVLDMAQVCLREANNKREFPAAKGFLDICKYLTTLDEDGDSVTMQERIAEHEIWRNTGFWLYTFESAMSSVRDYSPSVLLSYFAKDMVKSLRLPREFVLTFMSEAASRFGFVCPELEDGASDAAFAEESKGKERKRSALLRGESSGYKPPVLPGERLLWRLTGNVVADGGTVHGTLFLSTYRLHFAPSESSVAMDDFYKEFFMLPLLTIFSITLQSRSEVLIVGKDMRQLAFQADDEDVRSNRMEAFHFLLNRYAFPVLEGESSTAFAFMSEELRELGHGRDGWAVYDAEREFTRQGVVLARGEWQLSDINADYAFSPTYPALLVVPVSVSPENLRCVGGFRSKARIPALTYRHASNGACMLRSAQPMVGLSRKRCLEDEQYLRNSQVTAIFDARPRKNALANMAMGKGYELDEHYNIPLHFLDIENIHAMRESLRHWTDVLSEPDSDHFLSDLEGTKWLKHMCFIFTATVGVVEHISSGQGCLVHCSDGWDRTAQMCGLAQLCLDPFCRTLIGFQVLIEKDWLSFGHMFQRRIGHADSNSGDTQRSPVFLQFLDCVWQLLRQFPCSFEFNEDLLSFIMDSVFSCRFGTFLFNSERERKIARLSERTVSIWTYVNYNKDMFTNTYYSRRDGAIMPNVNSRVFHVWPYHARWSAAVRVQDPLSERERELRLEIEELRRDHRRASMAAASPDVVKEEEEGGDAAALLSAAPHSHHAPAPSSPAPAAAGMGVPAAAHHRAAPPSAPPARYAPPPVPAAGAGAAGAVGAAGAAATGMPGYVPAGAAAPAAGGAPARRAPPPGRPVYGAAASSPAPSPAVGVPAAGGSRFPIPPRPKRGTRPMVSPPRPPGWG
eukprot:PLAT6861.1.p1 GENE.PLAT6861.1~~PLAT6861.1.p1  ORF type:complete len:909 (+),score=335.47 PLAT6861.1:947-3673(+)